MMCIYLEDPCAQLQAKVGVFNFQQVWPQVRIWHPPINEQVMLACGQKGFRVFTWRGDLNRVVSSNQKAPIHVQS